MLQRTEERNGRSPTWLTGLTLLHVVFVSVLVFLAATSCARQDARSLPCLGWFSPLIDGIVAAGRRLAPYTLPRQLILPAGAVLVLAYVVARARTGSSRRDDRERLPAGETPITYPEALCLGLLTVVTVLYRFYLLNRIPSDSIAEVHFVYLASSDWQSLFRNNANEGAPLGLIHYLMAGGLWRWFGATMLTPRFAAAITSVVVTQEIYWFGRLVGGPSTALLAASFYAFSPVEMAWGRHDMFPFDNPSLLILPLGVVTYLAVTRFRFRYWLATALLMGASRHLFASGLSAFLAPVATIGWLALFDRDRARKWRWRPVILGLGIVLWAAGRSLAKFAANGSWQWFNPYSAGLSSRGLTREGGGLSALHILFGNVNEIFRGLFLGGFELDHQTPMGAYAPMPWIPPLVAILFCVGLVWCIRNRRDARASVFLPLLAMTTLPALMSIPDAHRMAAAFPVICTLAGLMAARGIATMIASRGRLGNALALALPIVIVVPMGVVAGAKYFEQFHGEPPPNTMAKAIRSFLQPDTLLVLDVPEGLDVEERFLLYDDALRDRIEIVVPGRDGQNPWPDVATDPHVLPNDVYHRETALRHRVTALAGMKWKRIVYVLHAALDRETKVRLLQSKYPDARVTDVSPPTWRPGYDFTAVEIRKGAVDVTQRR